MIITNPKNLTFRKDSLINYKFIATGGVAPYKFITKSILPAGLTLTKKGILKGTPTSEAGSAFNIRLKAISSTGESVFKQFVIVIDAPITTKSDLYVASYLDNLISMYSLDASTGALSSTSEYSTETLSVNDYKMCISNNKKNVYLTAHNQSVILVLNRDKKTGLLTFNSTISDGSSHLGSIAISKDDKNVYACDSDRIRSYDRNNTDGVLTYNSIPSVYAGTNLTDLCISSDGKNVYATIAMDNEIIVYNRNISTGILTQISSYATNLLPWVVVESIDGKFVYVTNYNSNSISIYARDTLTGLLTLRGIVSTFAHPTTIVVSPDNKNVYVLFDQELLVSVYSRSEGDGMLTYKTSNSTGSWPGASIVFSPDNKNVYVGTYTAIVVFNRDTIGNLSLNSTILRTVNFLSDMYIVSYPAPFPSFWEKPISGSVTFKGVTKSIAGFELANQNQTIPPSVYWESGFNEYVFTWPSFFVGVYNNIPTYTVIDNLGAYQFAFGSRPITPNTTQTYTDSNGVSPFISVTIQWGDSTPTPT